MSSEPTIDYANLPDENLGVLAREHGSTPIRLAAQGELNARQRRKEEAAAAEVERRHQEHVEALRAGQKKTVWEQLSAPVNVIGMLLSLLVGAVACWAAIKGIPPDVQAHATAPAPASSAKK